VTEQDFGTVVEGDKVQREFVFENAGDGVLVLGKVGAGCGCTAALPSGKEVAPSGQGKIVVSFRTQGYKGRIVKTISVESNDPQNPHLRLVLKGKVKRYISSEPEYVYFASIQASTGASQRVHVFSNQDAPFRIARLTCSAPEIGVSDVRRSAKGGYEFEVTVRPDLLPGAICGEVVVETDSSRQPRLVIRVFGNVARRGTAGG
jgi:hypothetical protein